MQRIIISVATLIMALFGYLAPISVHAQAGANPDNDGHQTGFGLGEVLDELVTGKNKVVPPTDLTVIIGRMIRFALTFVGVLFMVLMVYAGMLWMTARGNEKSVEKAREMIIAAVIGLLIVVSAYAITNVVVTAVSSE